MRRALPLLLSAVVVAGTAAPARDARTGRRHGPPDRASTSVRFGPGRARSALRYWTPGRMRTAQPVPMPARGLGLAAPSPLSPEARGRAALVPPHAPLRRSRRRSRIVPDPSVEPFSEQGRLFIRFGRLAGSCSATLVNTPSQRVAITAGHCLHMGLGGFGRWASSAVFVPGYHDGRRPFGSFTARAAEVLPDWFAFENDDYDVGAVVLQSNGLGRPGDVVGSRGWATGLSRRQSFQAFGYPAAANRGQHLRECDSGFRGLDHSTIRMPGPPTSRIRCDMAAGSSGGGWIINGSTLDGLISYFYPARRGFMYGPYFGLAVKRLIQRQP